MRRMPATAGGVAGPFDGEGSAHFFPETTGANLWGVTWLTNVHIGDIRGYTIGNGGY